MTKVPAKTTTTENFERVQSNKQTSRLHQINALVPAKIKMHDPAYVVCSFSWAGSSTRRVAAPRCRSLCSPPTPASTTVCSSKTRQQNRVSLVVAKNKTIPAENHYGSSKNASMPTVANEIISPDPANLLPVVAKQQAGASKTTRRSCGSSTGHVWM